MTEANPHWTHNEVPGEILRLPNRQVFHGEASIADETVDYTLAFQLWIVGTKCRINVIV